MIFIERVSPAFEQVDGSSGAIGSAVSRAIEDLVECSPGDEGKWFAAAKDAGLLDFAFDLARRSPCDPRTLLVRSGNDLVLVAEIGGHKRLETTRRYTLPSASDKERAMERLTE